MIVYRDQRTRAEPRHLLSDLRSGMLRLETAAHPVHDAAAELLIRLGTLESAVADTIFADADGIHPIACRFREASTALGHVVWHTWRGQPEAAVRWCRQCSASLAYLEIQSLPPTVEMRTPEGYAHYAVYPETYLEAARRCHAELGVFDAVCLGLRTIGCSLAAVAAAALEELGCRVVSHTLRPRGHPFHRSPILTPELGATFAAKHNARFLVIDEGPGISGSSLGGTAELLHGLGIRDDRILLFPSWPCDGTALQSSIARAHWPRHQQFIASFDEVWVESGRLTDGLPAGRLRDYSAGAWRGDLYSDQTQHPPVHPQHERRKYLLDSGASRVSAGARWLSFSGLGGRAATSLHRARRLAENGFVPPPESIVHGFLVRRFVQGAPTSADQVDRSLLETVASYLAHLSLEHRAEPSVSEASLRHMTTINVAEGLGEEWLERLQAILPTESEAWYERPVALDGRMLPHEWIRTRSGYLKTDALDHHDDHFFPGCQDVAWDVAAACLEFDLHGTKRHRLVERYRDLSRDQTIGARLRHHAVSYLAFRLGYTTLASATLGETADGGRFAADARRYRRLLRLELGASREQWSA